MNRATRPPDRRDEVGQALAETLLAILIALGPSVAAVGLARAQWERFRCARAVFERTHEVMVRGSVPALPSEAIAGGGPRVRIMPTSTGFRGEAVCGGARERVELPRLEAAQW
jgi:hypothetical protein